jgi:hypothetical protein
MPTRKRVNAQREGISVRTRWGWGPSAKCKKEGRMPHQVKHFGTSGEIAVLIEQVNKWLKENATIEVVAVSESQGGRLGDENDPFYYSMNVVYRSRD